jgi:NADH-quinone oxidoreductase subunit F
MYGKPTQIMRKTNLKALQKAMEIGPNGVLDILEKKGLVGRGGAAFPTAKKWRMALSVNTNERYVICNADEGEPGTFKDKLIIEKNAETMVEGILIAAYTLKAKECFIYLRGEYEHLRPALQKTIDDVVKRAPMDIPITIVRGAGAYICGEETAIIRSIEGYQGQPYFKPPYPTIEGLWGKPTVINNVETLTCAAQALLFDDWDASLRLCSLSGNVTRPGVYELPLGVKLKVLVDLAKPAKKLKALSFGCFGGIMPFDENITITPESIRMEDCQHGAYSIILIDESQNVVDICLSIAKFYTYESCGKCTPCREGTIRVLNLLKKVRDGAADDADLAMLVELAEHIQATSLCGLGQTSGNHVLTALKHFPQDFADYMKR